MAQDRRGLRFPPASGDALPQQLPMDLAKSASNDTPVVKCEFEPGPDGQSRKCPVHDFAGLRTSHPRLFSSVTKTRASCIACSGATLKRWAISFEISSMLSPLDKPDQIRAPT